MRITFIRAWVLVAACGSLGACAGTGGTASYTAVSCMTPGAVRESPFNSTANPTEGPLPRAPGDVPCYLPDGDNSPAVADNTTPRRSIALGESSVYSGGH